MHCRECNTELQRLDNEHLLNCSGLTLQEYAIRHQLPLDLLLTADQVNQPDVASGYTLPGGVVSVKARAVFAGIRMAGLLQEEGEFTLLPGEIRRLDQLLWMLQYLQEFGFQFRQEYVYDNDTHRVVTRNRLKIPSALLAEHNNDVGVMQLNPTSDWLDSLAVVVACIGELHGGYVFLPFVTVGDVDHICEELYRQHRIRMKVLDALENNQSALLRAETLEDSQHLLALLKGRLHEIPGASDRFFHQTRNATVVKELVFDSAHFITDHPGKCSNLHGGRYQLQVKIMDRIDPITGFVVDYGYLKKVVKTRVINCLDHHNLNYAVGGLSWRSSTELLNMYIWEQLIDYLPGLDELQMYETAQSYCCYQGPSLAEFQAQGSDPMLHHFQERGLGDNKVRNVLRDNAVSKLKVVGHKE